MYSSSANRQRHFKRRRGSAKLETKDCTFQSNASSKSSSSDFQVQAVRLMQRKDKVLQDDAATVTAGRLTIKQGIFLKGKSSGTVSKGSLGWSIVSKARAEANLTRILELANNNDIQPHNTAVFASMEDNVESCSPAPRPNAPVLHSDEQSDVDHSHGEEANDNNNVGDAVEPSKRKGNAGEKYVGTNLPKKVQSERTRRTCLEFAKQENCGERKKRQSKVSKAYCSGDSGAHEPIFLKVEHHSANVFLKNERSIKPKIGFNANIPDAASASHSSEVLSSLVDVQPSQEIPYKRFIKRINMRLEESVNQLRKGRNLSQERLGEITRIYNSNFDRSSTNCTSAEKAILLLPHPAATAGPASSASYQNCDLPTTKTAVDSVTTRSSTSVAYSSTATTRSSTTAPLSPTIAPLLPTTAPLPSTTVTHLSTAAMHPSTTWCTSFALPYTAAATTTTTSSSNVGLLSLDFSIHPEQVITSPRTLLCKCETSLQQQQLQEQELLFEQPIRSSSDMVILREQMRHEDGYAGGVTTDTASEIASIRPDPLPRSEISQSRIFCAPSPVFDDGFVVNQMMNEPDMSGEQNQKSASYTEYSDAFKSGLGCKRSTHDEMLVVPFSIDKKYELYEYLDNHRYESTFPRIEEDLSTPIKRKTSTSMPKSVIVNPLRYLARCAEKFAKLPPIATSPRDLDSVNPEDNVIFPTRDEFSSKTFHSDKTFPSRTTEMGQVCINASSEVFVPSSFVFNPHDGGVKTSGHRIFDQSITTTNSRASPSVDAPVTIFDLDHRASRCHVSSTCLPSSNHTASYQISVPPKSYPSAMESDAIFPKIINAVHKNHGETSHSASHVEVVKNVSRVSNYQTSCSNHNLYSLNFPNSSALQSYQSCSKRLSPSINEAASSRISSTRQTLNEQMHRHRPSSLNENVSISVQQGQQHCCPEEQKAIAGCACMIAHSKKTQKTYCSHESLSISNDDHVNCFGNPCSSYNSRRHTTKCNCPGSSNQSSPCQNKDDFPCLVHVDVVRPSKGCAAHASSRVCHCASCIDKPEPVPRRSVPTPDSGLVYVDRSDNRCRGSSLPQPIMTFFVGDSDRRHLGGCGLPVLMSPSSASCSSASHHACGSCSVDATFLNRGGSQPERCSSGSQGCSQELCCDHSWQRSRAGMDWVDMNHSETFSETAPPIPSSLHSCSRRGAGSQDNISSEHPCHRWSHGAPPTSLRATSLSSCSNSKTCCCYPPVLAGARRHSEHRLPPTAPYQRACSTSSKDC